MLKIDSEQNDDGRWTAEVPALPGAFVYAHTKAAANMRAQALALQVIADRLEHGEPLPRELGALFEERGSLRKPETTCTVSFPHSC